jgi:flagellar motor component MotA
MKWFQRLSERVFRFAESREDVDRFINMLGRTVMALGIVAAVLVIAIVLQMTRCSR